MEARDTTSQKYLKHKGWLLTQYICVCGKETPPEFSQYITSAKSNSCMCVIMDIAIIVIKWYNNHYTNQQNPNDRKRQIRMISFAHFVDTSRCWPGNARDVSTTVSLSRSGNLLRVTSFLTTCAGWALTCVSWPLVPLPSPETTHCTPPRRSANKLGTAWVLHHTGQGRLRRIIAKGSMLSFTLQDIPVSRNFHHQQR